MRGFVLCASLIAALIAIALVLACAPKSPRLPSGTQFIEARQLPDDLPECGERLYKESVFLHGGSRGSGDILLMCLQDENRDYVWFQLVAVPVR